MSSRYVWVTDREAVEAALDAGQKPARARTMNHADVTVAVAELERRLVYLPKHERSGITVRISTGERVPNSYRGAAERTFATLAWGSKGWHVVGVGRERCPSVSYGTIGTLTGRIVLERWQADAMVARYLAAQRLLGAEPPED